jgi:hypothetical protein
MRSTLLEGPLPDSDTITMHCAAECHEYVMVDIVDGGDALDDEEGGWASPSTDSGTTPEKASSGNQVHSLGQHAPTSTQLIFSLFSRFSLATGGTGCASNNLDGGAYHHRRLDGSSIVNEVPTRSPRSDFTKSGPDPPPLTHTVKSGADPECGI